MTDNKKQSAESAEPKKPADPINFNELLRKTFLLKEFALKNGYEVDENTIRDLNDLRPYIDTQTIAVPTEKDVTGEKEAAPEIAVPAEKDVTGEKEVAPGKVVTAEEWNKLDKVIAALTTVTFPTTIDNLSDKSESDAYVHFKRWLFLLGIVGLIFAILGFVLTVASQTSQLQLGLGNSILALSLGLLGAVIYSLFNVLRIVPPQAFNPKDAYSNYARLLLGVLLGWVFYFAFGRKAFESLRLYLTNGTNTSTQTDLTTAFWLLAPFVAGYSTKFVVGILNRVIAALEIALGIEDKRDISARRVSSRRGV